MVLFKLIYGHQGPNEKFGGALAEGMQQVRLLAFKST
jgi:hypothetical protein